MAPHTRWTKIALAVASLVIASPMAALPHEPVVIPTRVPDGDGSRPRLLVGAKPGEHVGLVPAALAFGDVRIGAPASRDLEVRSVAGQALHLELVPTGSEVTVHDPVTGAVVSALDLAPLESRVLSVRFAPATVEPFSARLEVRSSHAGLGVARLDAVELSGFGRKGPTVRVREVVTGKPVVDFGRVSRRAYDFDERPYRDVVVENVGDQTATDLHVTYEAGSVSLGGRGCDDGSLLASYCFYLLAADGTEVGNTSFLGDLEPGESLHVRVRIHAWQVSYADRTFRIESEGDPGVEPAELDVFAEIVPFFLGIPGAPSQGVQAAEAADPGDGGIGRSTDPFAGDPLSTFRPTGFDARSLFDLGELDAVDTQSGNLVLTLPIGGPQVARAGLSYQLQAVYNSNVWARDTLFEPGAEGDINLPPEDQNRNGNPADKYPATNAEYPNPIYNSSPGWSVHLGRLLPPVDWVEIYRSSWQQGEKIINTGNAWTYVSPTGTLLRFWFHLNQAEPHYRDVASALSTAEYLYERSGSFMRLHRVSATVREVEMPDGRVHRFERKNASGQIPTHPDDWVLTEIRDQHGNSITVDYGTAGQPGPWTIDDGNRTVKIEFTAIQAPHPYAVDRIVFPGYDGGAERAYDFVYGSPVTLDRPVTSTWHRAFVPLVDRQLTLNRLSRIDLPDGTSFAFGYHEGDQRDLLLATAGLPTGGTVHWDYDRVADTSPDCLPVDDLQNLRVNGVSRRWVTEPSATGQRTLAETRYLRALRRSTDIPESYCEAVRRGTFEPYTDQVVGVWRAEETGLTSLTVEYFSKWPMEQEASTGAWSRRERSVNMTREEEDADGRLLASRLYSCSFGFADGPAVPFDTLSDNAGDVYGYDPGIIAGHESGAHTCSLLESRYVEYEVPITFPCEVSSPECGIGARILSSKRVFETDLVQGAPAFVTESNTHYDGVGHFRKTTTTSNFPDSPTVVRYTDHDATSGDLVLAADGTVSQDVTLPSSPWVLGTYSMQWTRQGTETMGGEARFTPAGLLQAARTWTKSVSGSTDVLDPGAAHRSSDDLVTLYEYSENGELLVERHFGASTYSVPTGDDWWSDDPERQSELYPASSQDWAMESGYQSGVVSRRRVVGQSVFEVFREIDASTGWTKQETRNSGEVVTYEYDAMGRPSKVDSDRLADTDYTYSPPGGARSTWEVAAETFATLDDGSRAPGSLTRFEVTFDGLGRVARERARHPDSSGSATVWATQETTYHPSGRVRRRTTLNNPDEHLEIGYDVKGRPVKETLPGGDTVVHQYTGDRIRNDLVWVNGVEGEEGAKRSQVRHRFDAYGRAIEMAAGEQVRTELPGGGYATSFTPIHTTTFTYSPRGDLQSAVRGSQRRTTTHDGRGFLTLESIPEKGSKTVVQTFDTRGNPLSSQEKVGASVVRRLRGQYDLLGRPTQLDVDGRVLKRWTYAPPCATADGSLATAELSGCAGSHGQLVTGERWNYRTPADLGGGIGLVCPSGSCQQAVYRVETTNSYDAAGRPRAQRLFVGYRQISPYDPGLSQESTSLHVLSKQSYDDLGRVTSLSYPCLLTGGESSCTPDRTIDFLYDEALLASVVEPGLGATFAYHPNGSIETVSHDNGLVDTYVADASGRARVSSIDLASGAWSRGYGYDPAGNVKAIGTDTFTYDVNSRLVDAVVRGESYHYDYDQFDNVTSWGTVDAATNRLKGGETAYDVFGSLVTAGDGRVVRYDDLDKMVAIYDEPAVTGCSGTCPGTFAVYDVADLRVFVHRPGGAPTWTVRDAGGNLLRDLALVPQMGNRKVKDYVHAGIRLLASETFDPTSGASQGVRHHHQDHLGSARVVSGPGGNALADFSPYGAATRSPAGERVGFTGHESDGNGLTTYMKGRTYLSVRSRPGVGSPYSEAGRFLQVDPGRDGWNQYAYGSGNPLSFIDTNGLEDQGVQDTPEHDDVDRVVTPVQDVSNVVIAADTARLVVNNIQRSAETLTQIDEAMSGRQYLGRAARVRALAQAGKTAVRGVGRALLRGAVLTVSVSYADDLAFLAETYINFTRYDLALETQGMIDQTGRINEQSALGKALGTEITNAEAFAYYQDSVRARAEGRELSPYRWIQEFRERQARAENDDDTDGGQHSPP